MASAWTDEKQGLCSVVATAGQKRAESSHNYLTKPHLIRIKQHGFNPKQTTPQNPTKPKHIKLI
jgi:hypothetical protein